MSDCLSCQGKSSWSLCVWICGHRLIDASDLCEFKKIISLISIRIPNNKIMISNDLKYPWHHFIISCTEQSASKIFQCNDAFQIQYSLQIQPLYSYQLRPFYIHYTTVMFGAMHFIYYINRSIATKVDSTYLGHWPTAHSVYVSWRELGSNSWRLDHRADAFPLQSTPHIP